MTEAAVLCRTRDSRTPPARRHLLRVKVSPFVFAMEMVRSIFSQYPGVNLVFYGLFLILVMIYYPGGLAQVYRSLLARSKSSIFLRWANARPSS